MQLIAVSTLAVGLLMFLLSLPLIFRKVPMNRVYGTRIKASFESDQRWYDINAYGGRQMAAWSWLVTLAGVAGFWIPQRYFIAYSWISAGITLVAVLMPCLLTSLWSRRKP